MEQPLASPVQDQPKPRQEPLEQFGSLNAPGQPVDPQALGNPESHDIPPPKNLPAPGTGSTVKYEANWRSLESRPIPEWYEDAKVTVLDLYWT